MITMSLHVGAKVYCHDEYCGDLYSVVMNRARGRITDLVIEPASAQARKTSRMIPVALTDYVDDRGVHLRIDRGDLETYPEGTPEVAHLEMITD